MPISHAPAHLEPLLRRLDLNFGGERARRDVEQRAALWARELAGAPLASVEAAVDTLLRTHDGHYPLVAQVRRLAMEHARRHYPSAVTEGAVSDVCPTCGEVPGWHPVLLGTGTVLPRLLWRHREGRPCARFNQSYRFVDGTEPAPTASHLVPAEATA